MKKLSKTLQSLLLASFVLTSSGSGQACFFDVDDDVNAVASNSSQPISSDSRGFAERHPYITGALVATTAVALVAAITYYNGSHVEVTKRIFSDQCPLNGLDQFIFSRGTNGAILNVDPKGQPYYEWSNFASWYEGLKRACIRTDASCTDATGRWLSPDDMHEAVMLRLKNLTLYFFGACTGSMCQIQSVIINGPSLVSSLTKAALPAISTATEVFNSSSAAATLTRVGSFICSDVVCTPLRALATLSKF